MGLVLLSGSAAFFLCLHNTIVQLLSLTYTGSLWNGALGESNAFHFPASKLNWPFICQCSTCFFCMEWHEADHSESSPCSSPLFPLRASRWACFHLQTDKEKRWSTWSDTINVRMFEWINHALIMMQAQLVLWAWMIETNNSHTERHFVYLSARAMFDLIWWMFVTDFC